MNHDSLEDLLRSTAAETRSALATTSDDLPPFEPNSNRVGIAVAVVVALLVVGTGGWLIASMSNDAIEVETAIEPPELEGITEEDSTNDESISGDPITSPTTEAPSTATVTDLDVREQVDLAKPSVGESVVDPAFGSTITRITDARAGERIIPVQSPAAVWNADESLMLLYQTGAGIARHIVVDAVTFEIVGELAVRPTDIEHVFWHPQDPDLIVTTVDLSLVVVSVTTGEIETIVTYPQCDWVDPGTGTSGPSWDGSLIALRCGIGNATQVIAQPLDGTAFSSIDVAEGGQGMASPDGRSIIIETDDGFDIYNADLTELTSVIDWEASAPTTGVDGSGASVIVSAGFESDFPGSLVIARLDGGSGAEGQAGETAVEVIVGPDTGYPFPRSGTQVAANSGNGLLVSASPLPVEVQEGGPIEVFDGEVVIADLRTSPPTVQRLAHSRNFAAAAFSETVVATSPSGRFVAFASDWGGDATDTYIIDLG